MPPLLTSEGRSSLSSLTILFCSSLQGLRRSIIAAKAGHSTSAKRVLIRSTAESAICSWYTSRGLIRPTTIFEIILSKSPILDNSWMSRSRRSASLNKWVTTDNLSLISWIFFSGNKIIRFSKRPPIGVIVLSIISYRDLPSGWIVETSSRLRIVKSSIHTYLSPWIRVNWVICPKLSWWVWSR